MKYDFDLEDHSKRRKEIFLRVLLWILELGVVLFAAYAITHYGLEKMTVSGGYMSPTLKDGDEILINKMSYRLHGIERNDVVVVKHNGAQHNYFTVERVIGLPGEKLQIKDGIVYIDGEKLKEKYKFPKMENGGLALEEMTLSTGEYFMLCDNRNECEDSRNANVGNVWKEDIVGKAWMRTNSLSIISHINGFKKQKKKSDASASPAVESSEPEETSENE
ncbi:MAG: signal peptidase I [Lachnospiraceae bacterium]|nr:signal peptidase I [Lachnospiraceae bacterium]